MLRAALHVHSTYSDGEFTLAELRTIFAAKDCSVVCMTDHAEGFDRHKLRDYVQECQSLSDDKFLFVSGLEFECEQRMHILGFGTTTLANTEDPQHVIRHIEEERGISVIAHPKNAMFSWIESFKILPFGIETWNSKYDGRYAPRPSTFELLHRLRQRRPEMRAFYGQDLHWKNQFCGLFTLLECESRTAGSVLKALEAGRYTGMKAHLRLPSSGVLPDSLMTRFAAEHAKSDSMSRFLKAAKATIDKLGITVPASLKSQLRRLL